MPLKAKKFDFFCVWAASKEVLDRRPADFAQDPGAGGRGNRLRVVKRLITESLFFDASPGQKFAFFFSGHRFHGGRLLESSMVQQFREKLESFVFFHLGSDAKLALQQEPDSLAVHLEHKRIRPLRFTIDSTRLATILAAPDLFEEMMLEYLVAYRRS